MGNASNLTVNIVVEGPGGQPPPLDLETQQNGERTTSIGRARRWFTRPGPPGPLPPEGPSGLGVGPCLW